MAFNYPYILMGVGVMALVTYIPRAAPLVLFRRKITHPFFRSLLHYIPYAILSAMTFPDILFATSSVYSGLAALAAGLAISFFERGLLLTAIGAVLAAFVTEMFLL
jgi:branched-subunit amino acid transport protein